MPAILQLIEKTSNENHVWKLLFLFPLLPVALSLRDAPKKHLEWTEMGGHKQSLGGTASWTHRSDGTPGPTVATALATSTKNDIPVASFVNSR